MTREMLRRILSKRGWSVTEAADGLMLFQFSAGRGRRWFSST